MANQINGNESYKKEVMEVETVQTQKTMDALSDKQLVLIGVMTKNFVLVTVSIITTLGTIVSIAVRAISSSMGFSTQIQANLVACMMFGFILDFLINMFCVCLQFEFWNQKKYQCLCSWLDSKCNDIFKQRAIKSMATSQQSHLVNGFSL